MAAYAHHAMVLGYEDEELNRFFARALFTVGEDLDMEQLLPVVLEVGKYNLGCMGPARPRQYQKPTATPFPPSSR